MTMTVSWTILFCIVRLSPVWVRVIVCSTFAGMPSLLVLSMTQVPLKSALAAAKTRPTVRTRVVTDTNAILSFIEESSLADVMNHPGGWLQDIYSAGERDLLDDRKHPNYKTIATTKH